MSALTLTGLSAVFAGVVSSALAWLKAAMATHLPAKWQARIPDTIFYLLALAIPVSVCVALGINDFASITGTALPSHWQALGAPGTGVIIGATAAGGYKAKEALIKPALAKAGIVLPKSSWQPPGPGGTT